jgi:hypothetical protein
VKRATRSASKRRGAGALLLGLALWLGGAPAAVADEAAPAAAAGSAGAPPAAGTASAERAAPGGEPGAQAPERRAPAAPIPGEGAAAPGADAGAAGTGRYDRRLELPRSPAYFDDASGLPQMIPIQVPGPSPRSSRSMVWIGGLIVLAAVFLWNRSRRLELERAEEAARERAGDEGGEGGEVVPFAAARRTDEDADDLAAAARRTDEDAGAAAGAPGAVARASRGVERSADPAGAPGEDPAEPAAAPPAEPSREEPR